MTLLPINAELAELLDRQGDPTLPVRNFKFLAASGEALLDLDLDEHQLAEWGDVLAQTTTAIRREQETDGVPPEQRLNLHIQLPGPRAD
jgi:hypothetical protein